MECLAGAPDARRDKGKRFEWRFQLEIICAPLVSGRKSVRGIAEWAMLRAKESLMAGEVDGPNGQVWRGQAVDGNRVRGASAHGEQVRLASVVRHELAPCWAKRG